MSDLDDLLLVISDKADVERDAVADVWASSGGEVLRLGRFWDPPALDPMRVRLYGAETFCAVVAQKLGLTLVSPPDDLMLHLPSNVTKRRLQRTTLADISSLAFPAFVKSAIPKLIKSRVYRAATEVETETRGVEPMTELLISEVLELTAEVRCWTLDGKVLSAAIYEGNADLDAACALAEDVAALSKVPSPCVVDVGLSPERGWLLIEANAAWGSGLNGCSPLAAARCIAKATVPERGR